MAVKAKKTAKAADSARIANTPPAETAQGGKDTRLNTAERLLRYPFGESPLERGIPWIWR